MNIFSLSLIALVFIYNQPSHAEFPSCVCPKTTCNKECEVESDMTFYSEKCGDGTRVRSCSKSKCLPKQDAPAKCLQAVEPTKIEDIGPEQTETAEREIASEPTAVDSVGRFQMIDGAVYIQIAGTRPTLANVGDEVREGDRVTTQATGRAQILFHNGNMLNVTKGSEVLISAAPKGSDDKAKTKREAGSENLKTVLDLIKGRIRSKVSTKCETKTPCFEVKTKGAVAGVRGTDFVVTFTDEKSATTSKVETLEGKVELKDELTNKFATVGPAESGSFVIARQNVLGANEKTEVVEKSYLTPVFKMPPAQLAALDAETKFLNLTAAKVSAPKEEASICTSPSGRLNQCSWTCENNPDGQKSCRVDMSNVKCVRRVCNANGQWSDAARLPSSYVDACRGDQVVVKSCDY